ncbi:hypothetical protein [Cyanobium sp. CH-040]|uniref:hypothetical protein n=1 Tax=Cyanobium sp. CH-040 TaxID=2823708 RepID=UPI0020CC4284|nr:hypothetical protein [Cyanobium sp. CH-040]MCP9929133.1 hypothetical protein [Cyanobium sp. CH-040]
MARFAPDLDLRPYLDQARTRILALRHRWRRSPLEPLTLPFVAAVLVNAVGLGLLQARQHRLVTAQEAPAAEDTRQLLELSEGLEAKPGLNTVAVPLGDSLPPPPPDLLADAGGDTGLLAAVPGTDAAEAPAADTDSPETVAAPSPASGDDAAEPPQAAAVNPEAPAGEPEATLTTIAGLLLLSQPANPYDVSWETATAQGTPPDELGKLPAGLALRSLPVDAARRAGLPVVHGQSVLVDDRLYLLWVKDTTLWMMRAEFGSARPGAGTSE